ncbi:MAG TPA: hypothetical protein VH763_12305 [Gemmatimonadales bacterium]|jgi:hypothetical protein
MVPHRTKATEAETIAHEHLVRILLEQLERTFETSGKGEALRQIEAMLRLLDPAALRALVYQQGLQDESELSESENEPDGSVGPTP